MNNILGHETWANIERFATCDAYLEQMKRCPIGLAEHQPVRNTASTSRRSSAIERRAAWALG